MKMVDIQVGETYKCKGHSQPMKVIEVGYKQSEYAKAAVLMEGVYLTRQVTVQANRVVELWAAHKARQDAADARWKQRKRNESKMRSMAPEVEALLEEVLGTKEGWTVFSDLSFQIRVKDPCVLRKLMRVLERGDR